MVAKYANWLFWFLQILQNLFELFWSIISKVIEEKRKGKKKKKNPWQVGPTRQESPSTSGRWPRPRVHFGRDLLTLIPSH